MIFVAAKLTVGYIDKLIGETIRHPHRQSDTLILPPCRFSNSLYENTHAMPIAIDSEAAEVGIADLNVYLQDPQSEAALAECRKVAESLIVSP